MNGEKLTMSNTHEVKQVMDIIVKLLPTVEHDRVEKLANLIVNHPNTYPDDSFQFDECVAFVVAKHRFNNMYKTDK